MAQRLPVTRDPIAAMAAAPQGPGILLANVVDFSLAGLLAAKDGDESRGIHLGMFTSAPEIEEDPDTQNLLDDVVGLNAEFKGSKQPGTQTATISAEIVELTPRTIKMMQPGLKESDWTNEAHAHVKVGDGNSRIGLTARTPGTTGNAISIVLTAGTGNNAPTVVSVSANAISVVLGTGAGGTVSATAQQVVDLINAHAAAKLLVNAGLAPGSNGSGVMVAAASQNLAGGAASTGKLGVVLEDKGFWTLTDYLFNMTFVIGTTFQDVFHVYELRGALSTDSFNPQYDDGGAVTGISAMWSGHVDNTDRDPDSGQYRRPLRKRIATPALTL